MKTIQNHLLAFQQQPRMQAGSIIVSVFGDAIYPRGGAIWLGCLIQLLAPLGLNQRLIRTAIFRLVKEEWLQTQTHGNRTNYLLSATGRARIEEASHQIYANESPAWDQQWRILLTSGDHAAKDREQLRRALYWQGFGQWNSQTFIHPSADLQKVLSTLKAEGLGHWQTNLLALTGQASANAGGISHTQVAQQAWDLTQLGQHYARFLKTYQAIYKFCADQPPKSLSHEHAFLLRILLVHDFRRLLLRDPALPASLLPAHWQGLQARLLFNKLYKLLLNASEKHLDQHVRLADGSSPKSNTKVLKSRIE